MKPLKVDLFFRSGKLLQAQEENWPEVSQQKQTIQARIHSPIHPTTLFAFAFALLVLVIVLVLGVCFAFSVCWSEPVHCMLQWSRETCHHQREINLSGHGSVCSACSIQVRTRFRSEFRLRRRFRPFARPATTIGTSAGPAFLQADKLLRKITSLLLLPSYHTAIVYPTAHRRRGSWVRLLMDRSWLGANCGDASGRLDCVNWTRLGLVYPREVLAEARFLARMVTDPIARNRGLAWRQTGITITAKNSVYSDINLMINWWLK